MSPKATHEELQKAKTRHLEAEAKLREAKRAHAEALEAHADATAEHVPGAPVPLSRTLGVANNQISQMKEFILNEAKDRAEEINAASLQDFSIAKAKHLNDLKANIEAGYAKKVKALETQNAIAKSTAVNRSRLEKIKARQDVLAKVANEAKSSLKSSLQSKEKMSGLVQKLIVQGLLMLLEDDVKVRCRAADKQLVEGVLGNAAQEYTALIKDQTGADKKVSVSVDGDGELSADCLGGVVLTCQGGSIKIDNTLDSRLDLVMDQAKPTIRKLLFEK